VGLRIEDENGALILAVAPRRYAPLADTFLTASNIVPDGDPKVPSEQSLHRRAAPEPGR
jgi:hypothetical protein